MPKYKNLNYITLIAMFMIINIHFFNTFATDVNEKMTTVMILLRGFALPAVALYLANTAFTAFYLKKGVNYKSLFLFIIIPTLLLTDVQQYMFDMNPVQYNFKSGFNYSWYGEMYIYMMLLVPLALYLDAKNKNTKRMMLGYSFAAILFGYYYSILDNSTTVMSLGLGMMFPYIGLTYVLYRIIDFGIDNMKKIEISKSKKITLLIVILICVIIEALAYGPFDSIGMYAKSYFSIITIIFASSMWLLIYSLDLTKLPNVRRVSQSSYFLYFVHWILIRAFKFYAPDFTVDHTMIAYFTVIIGSFIISTILFELYSKFVLRVMKL